MIHKFFICDQPVHVHLTEVEAMQDPDIQTAFVISLEDICDELHCDLFGKCSGCPIVDLCDTHDRYLPEILIRMYAPQLITDYAEYFI